MKQLKKFLWFSDSYINYKLILFSTVLILLVKNSANRHKDLRYHKPTLFEDLI